MIENEVKSAFFGEKFEEFMGDATSGATGVDEGSSFALSLVIKFRTNFEVQPIEMCENGTFDGSGADPGEVTGLLVFLGGGGEFSHHVDGFGGFVLH